jgi:pimeloyl-ACP methyl ester carboxylesterase
MDYFTTDDGERVFYRVSGSGPPLVILHEWSASHHIWEPLIRVLQEDFTVCRWDARGHGGHSPTGSEAPTVSRLARDLEQLLDHLSLDRPLVVGSSMGALILWEYIDQRGYDRLSRICVIDQSPRLRTDANWRLGIYGDWTAERDAAFVAGLGTDFVETVMRLIAHGHNRRARLSYEAGGAGMRRLRAYLSTLDPAPLTTIWKSLTAADYRPVLPHLDIPALLVYGSESNYYGVSTGQYVARSMPRAELIVYEGADHSPHICQPRRFVADLKRFAGRSHEACAASPGTAAI